MSNHICYKTKYYNGELIDVVNKGETEISNNKISDIKPKIRKIKIQQKSFVNSSDEISPRMV